MEWLVNAFWAKIGWALGELALAASIMLAVVFVLAFANLPRLIRQTRCKHTRFHETGKCDAICTDCGKNLGFIGAWRAKLAALSRT